MNGHRRGARRSREMTSWPHEAGPNVSALALLCFLLLLICWMPKSSSAERVPYMIGGVVSTTGSYADWGTQLAEGEAFTIKQQNEMGGIKGYPVKYVPSDDEGKPDRALSISKMLIVKDKVLAIVAGGLTTTVTAISPYLNQVGVPFIFSAGGKTYDLSKERYMFGVLPNTPILVDNRLRFLKAKGMARVAMVADNTALGEERAAYTPGAAKRTGVNLIELTRFSIKDMDMTAMLARVKSKNPEWVILDAGGDDAVRIIKQMKQIGLNVPVSLPVACVDNIFVRNLGDLAMGKTDIYADGNYLMTLDTIPDTDPRKIKSRAFVQSFEKEYGKKFNYGNGVGYDKMETILKAIEAVAPSADKIDYNNADQLKRIREDIRTWLEHTKGLELLTATFSRTPEDHIGTRDVGIVRLMDQRWISVQ